MSYFVDFTIEGRHTKFFDCYVVCGESKFMSHRNMLCKLDFFDRIIYGKLEVKEFDSKPMCTIPDEYEQYINILLNYMYNSELYYTDIDIMELISIFDYICHFDVVCKLINNVYEDLSFDEYNQLIEYITDKEKILTGIDYQKITTFHTDPYKITEETINGYNCKITDEIFTKLIKSCNLRTLKFIINNNKNIDQSINKKLLQR